MARRDDIISVRSATPDSMVSASGKYYDDDFEVSYDGQVRIWRPIHGGSITDSEYRPICNIARILHFEDYKSEYVKEAFITDRIDLGLHSTLPIGVEGLWFTIINNREEHNCYGNVSLEVNFKDFIENFKPKWYFTEVVQYTTHTAPRLLLTTQNVPAGFNLPVYNSEERGGPLYKDNNGKYHYLTQSRRFRNKGKNTYPCTVEIFVILSETEREILHAMCSKFAVNHELADVKKLNHCKKYYSEPQKKMCPSPWTIEECRNQCPHLRKQSTVSLDNIDDLSESVGSLCSYDPRTYDPAEHMEKLRLQREMRHCVKDLKKDDIIT